MIEHVKQHETLSKLYQNQQQQQSQSHVANNSQQQQQQQQQVSQVRNERSPPEGNNSITVSSPTVDNNTGASTTLTPNTAPSNMSVFPMTQISPGLPSMLDELCLAATTWNTFYTQQQQQQQQQQQPNNMTSTGVAVPQLPKALVAHSTINQNHIPNGNSGNSMVLVPGQQLQQQQQQPDVPPKPKKKKKKKKPKVRLDDIFECNICHQTFATEFHRNIHANSHKYYDGSRGNKSPVASLSLVAAGTDIGNKAASAAVDTTISSNINVTNTVISNNVNNSNSSTGASATGSNPATPHATHVSVNTTNTSATTCSYNVTMVDTSGTYVPSSYGMTAAVAPSTAAGMSTYGMTSAVPNAFQTAASLPTMVPMATPNHQYPVTMTMAAQAPHPIFPLIHRPASNALSAPVAHHPVTQQPLFPQPLPQPVFPQR